MIRAELTCHNFSRTNNVDRIIHCFLDTTADNLAQILALPGVFTVNTRTADQVANRMVHCITGLLMLVTILKSWQLTRPFARTWLEILKVDPEFKYRWSLYVWDDQNAELPVEISSAHLTRIPSQGSEGLLELTEEDIDVFVNNFGERNTLW